MYIYLTTLAFVPQATGGESATALQMRENDNATPDELQVYDDTQWAEIGW